MTIISNTFVNLFYIGLVAPLLFFNGGKANSITTYGLFVIILVLIVLFTGKPKMEISMNNTLKVINWSCVIPILCYVLLQSKPIAINESYIKFAGLVLGGFHLLKCVC